jgi:hypothetical protein
MKYGDSSVVQTEGWGTLTCSVLDCGQPHIAKGFCVKHYQRHQSNGDPLVVRHGGGCCEGVVTYTAVHRRLRLDRGPASQYPCFECLGRAQDWAYDNVDPNELVGGKYDSAYSLNPDHYVPLCRPCHAEFDQSHRERAKIC